MTSKPETVSQEAWQQALTVQRNLAGNRADGISLEDFDGNTEVIARAIMAAEKRGEERATLVERAACAAEAEAIAKGRYRQSADAKSIGGPRSGGISRDFESMAMSAVDVASAIRKRSEVNTAHHQKVLED